MQNSAALVNLTESFSERLFNGFVPQIAGRGPSYSCRLLFGTAPRLYDIRGKRFPRAFCIAFSSELELCCERVAALSCAGECYGLLEAQRDWSLDVLTKAAALVEDNTAGGIELCEQVEINNISSQNRTSVLSCCCKEQSVIQRSSPMISTVSLQTREYT